MALAMLVVTAGVATAATVVGDDVGTAGHDRVLAKVDDGPENRSEDPSADSDEG